MSENEPGIPEIVRTLQRIERLLESFVTDRVFQITITSMNSRLDELEESHKWAMRLVVGAVMLALTGIAIGTLR